MAAADAIAAGETPRPDAIGRLRERLDAGPPDVSDSDSDEAALRLVDGWGWLHNLVDDLEQLSAAFAPSPRRVQGVPG